MQGKYLFSKSLFSVQNYVDQLYICFPIKDIKTYYQNFLNSMVWQASERRGREGVRERGSEGV